MNVMQIAMAGLGAFGFSILFQVRGGKLALCALGGILSWVTYLLLVDVGAAETLAMLGASVFASVYSESMARLAKAPATVFYVPAVIPLVPGASLYYTMNAAVQGDWVSFGLRGFDTLGFAAAIAGGIVIVISLRSLFRSFISLFSGRKSKEE